jgi:tRNA (guanine37-N1)-methyltransferase
MAPINFHILSIFPDIFEGFKKSSMISRAINNGFVTISIYDIRQFTDDKHNTTDDYQFGGGTGMVMKPEPIYYAVNYILKNCADTKNTPVILLTPQGTLFSQEAAQDFTTYSDIIYICGHYTGIDERIKDLLVTHEISIGDFIVTGGEIPAMLVCDCISRCIPGVIGAQSNVESDSITSGLLEHPLYTRPRSFNGMDVPDILVNGDHNKISTWRRKESLKRTLLNRPDLLEKYPLSLSDQNLLHELQDE